jgi:hypothetical protein
MSNRNVSREVDEIVVCHEHEIHKSKKKKRKAIPVTGLGGL